MLETFELILLCKKLERKVGSLAQTLRFLIDKELKVIVFLFLNVFFELFDLILQFSVLFFEGRDLCLEKITLNLELLLRRNIIA